MSKSVIILLVVAVAVYYLLKDSGARTDRASVGLMSDGSDNTYYNAISMAPTDKQAGYYLGL